MPLADGQVIAGYTILRSLGAGGMGEVYLAQHPRLPRRDALKVLSASVCSESEYRKRFNREADIAATLWHPHIVGVHDRGNFEGQLWISMDYVDGTDAGRLLRERYRNGMPTAEVARIVTPETLLAWHRKLIARKYAGTAQRWPGRTRTAGEIEAWVVRMAQENRDWGYRRILGALSNLGYRSARRMARKMDLLELCPKLCPYWGDSALISAHQRFASYW